MSEYEVFKKKFACKPEFTGYVTCEREVFLADRNCKIIPEAANFLSRNNLGSYVYELSACQVEYHIGPVTISEFKKEASEKVSQLMTDALNSGYCIRFDTVGPEDVPLDVYNAPKVVTKKLPRIYLTRFCRLHVELPEHIFISACLVLKLCYVSTITW